MLLYIIAIIVSILLALLSIYIVFVDSDRVVSCDETTIRRFIFDISSYTDSNWTDPELHCLKSKEDLEGVKASVKFQMVNSSFHSVNQLVRITQRIIVYVNPNTSSEAYESQRNWIFTFQKGIPPSNQDFEYNDIQIRQDLSAEQYHVACIDLELRIRCEALMRYENVVVFLEVILMSNDVEYLSRDDFLNMVMEVDNRQIE